jgi:cytochrome c
MWFDKQGNLYLTVGNNTANPISAQHRMMKDLAGAVGMINAAQETQTTCAERSYASIPKMTASYSIPEGNLFPKEHRRRNLRSM